MPTPTPKPPKKREHLETDLLIVGGGTAGCYAAVEAKTLAPQLKVTILEKAHIDRSGCLAPGTNAINVYLHPNETPESYVRWNRWQSMGLLREDLALTMIREINATIKTVEGWGLPVLKEENGDYKRRGRWGVPIRGESIKPILAGAVKRAGVEVLNRVSATNLLKSHGRIVGAVGFGVRDEKFCIIRSKATIIATGGAAGLYRPYNDGACHHLLWYSPFNVGSGFALGMRAGAELTGLEMRFCAIRLKDVNSPIGATALGFNAPVINAKGEKFMQTRFADVGGEGAPTPLRTYGPTIENLEGRGPCYIDTRGMNPDQVKAFKMAYLDAFPTLVLLLASRGVDPSQTPIEIHGTDPYIVGGHCSSGYWVTEDRTTTLPGLYAAGDVAGGVPNKYVGGCFAEGAVAARAAVRYIQTQRGEADLDGAQIDREEVRVFAPLAKGTEAQGGVAPKGLEEALQRVMDQYAGGVGRSYRTNGESLKYALGGVRSLKTQVEHLVARDLHELLLAHDVIDRLEVAEASILHMLYREETRWPGYLERMDHPKRDDERWLLFVNSKKNPETGEIEAFPRPYTQIVAGDRYKP